MEPSGPALAAENGETVIDLPTLTRRSAEAKEHRLLGEQSREQGDFEGAAAHFRRSIDLYPTAEAYVALAWSLAARELYDQAIAACQQAIALDPDAGNAYNDIGVYLIQIANRETDPLRRIELNSEAVGWLERALAARRYDCRNYPYFHLGQLKELQGRFMEARDYYLRSLQEDPNWPPARDAYHRALAWLN